MAKVRTGAQRAAGGVQRIGLSSAWVLGTGRACGQHGGMPDIIWKSEPEEHDYPAAASYLSLLCAADEVEVLVAALRERPIAHFKAKDLLRASGLALLRVDNPHVSADLHKVAHGRKLSPVLLVRGDLASRRSLQIADGYHRVCASYHTDENTDIPCRLVGYGS